MRNKRILKVLVIDDDAMARHHIAAQIRRLGYQVASVSGPEEARDLLKNGGSSEFDCVVTDCWMPDQTGLDVLQWLRRCDYTLASVVVSGDAEKEVITQSLRGGASDFLEKPVSLNELANALDKAIRSTLRRRENVTTERVLRQVGVLQQRLNGFNLMGELPLEVTLCNYPQHEAGGDSTAFFLTPDHELLAIVMDVSGHDLRAAIISAYFQGMLRGNIDAGQPLVSILGNFNSYLVNSWTDLASQAGNSPGITSLAVFALRWNLGTNDFASLNSGFPLPVLIDKDGNPSFCGSEGSYPLGWFEPNPIDELRWSAKAGQRMLIWTDGLVDLAAALDVSTLSAAYRLIQSERQAIKAEMVDDATDDILLVDILVPPQPGDGLPFFPLLAEQYDQSHIGQIDAIQKRWRKSIQLALPSLPEQITMDILLCSREAVLNALIHGCDSKNPAPVSGSHFCQIRMLVSPDESMIRVIVSDTGPGHRFDVNTHAELAAEELVPHHRGLILIHQIPCFTTSERNGAIVQMAFSLHRPSNSTCNQSDCPALKQQETLCPIHLF